MDKLEADAVQEVIHEVIEASRPPSSEEVRYEILHGRSYPCHICCNTYKRSQQLSMHNRPGSSLAQLLTNLLKRKAA